MDVRLRLKGHNILTLLVLVFASVLPFLTSLPKMIGEPFDTRFQIVVHEHWFWVLQLERPLRDAYIFYPFNKTLGFSDIFFGNGIIYSLFRLTGLDILDAWTLTNFFILLLGNIGFAFLLNNLLKNKFLLLLSLFVMTNTYAFLGFLNIWPNTVGYALVSWVLFFIYKIYHSSESKFVVWVNYLLIFLPLLTLSYWYPGFFSIIGTIVFLIFAVLSKNRDLKTKIKLLFSKASLVKILRLSPVWLSLWGLFFYVTLPTRDNLNRAPEEIFDGSLAVNDFFSIDLLEPTLIKNVFSIFFDINWLSANHKWAVGFPVITIILFSLISIFFIKKILSFNSLQSFTFFVIILALILTVRVNETGLYVFLWQNFDFLGIIRTPVRLNILINFLLMLFVFKYLDEVISHRKRLKYFALFLASVLIVDQFRVLPGTWSKSDLIDNELLRTSRTISSDCESIVLLNTGAGHWSDTIEGMVLSSLINIPTINGYSGTFPKDSIQRNWDDPSSYMKVINYINRNQLSQMGCFVTNKTHFKFNKQTQLYIDSSNVDDNWESNSTETWKWIEQEIIEMQISNPFEYFELDKNYLYLEKSSCLKDLKLDIQINKESFTVELDADSDTHAISLPRLTPMQSTNIKITSNQSGCQVDPDPRSLIYSIGFQE